MDFSQLFQSMQQTLGQALPGVLGALAVFVVGWLVALAARGGVRKLLSLARVNRMVESGTDKHVDVEGGAARATFFVVMLITLLAVFNTLNLELVGDPLTTLVDKVFAFLPQAAAAAVLLLVAWIVATLVRSVARRALSASGLDNRVQSQEGTKPVSENLSNVLYWLVLLLFLPGILGALRIEGLLAPVQRMTEEFLAMVPNLIGAAAIGLVGWFVASILRDLVANLLAATGADQGGARVGLREPMTLSRVVGLVVYTLVLLPSLIAALNALELEPIVAPATAMLDSVLAAIPNVFAAGLILAIAWFVARLARDLITNLLAGAGFDRIPSALGIEHAFPGETKLSGTVGKLFVFFVMLFATVEAANRLGFTNVSSIVAVFLQFGGQVLLGAVIMGIGVWLANLAFRTMVRVNGEKSAGVANVVRFTILGLVIAMGLGAMGVAERIVQLAFGLTLGSVAVAVALSFGLGGREAAGQLTSRWLSGKPAVRGLPPVEDKAVK